MFKLFSRGEWLIVLLALCIWGLILFDMQLQMNHYDNLMTRPTLSSSNNLPKLDKI
jgi:hypothetical protein